MLRILCVCGMLFIINAHALEQSSVRGDIALSTLETKVNGDIITLENQINTLDGDVKNCGDTGQLLGAAGCNNIEQADVANLPADLSDHETRIIQLENKLVEASICAQQNKLYDFETGNCAADPNRQSCEVYTIRHCSSGCSPSNVSVSPVLDPAVASRFAHRYGRNDHIRGIKLNNTTQYEVAACSGTSINTVYVSSSGTVLGRGCFFRGDSDDYFDYITARICTKTGL